MNSLQDDREITFEIFCGKYKIIYSVKPYTFDAERNSPNNFIHVYINKKRIFYL